MVKKNQLTVNVPDVLAKLAQLGLSIETSMEHIVNGVRDGLIFSAFNNNCTMLSQSKKYGISSQKVKRLYESFMRIKEGKPYWFEDIASLELPANIVDALMYGGGITSISQLSEWRDDLICKLPDIGKDNFLIIKKATSDFDNQKLVEKENFEKRHAELYLSLSISDIKSIFTGIHVQKFILEQGEYGVSVPKDPHFCFRSEVHNDLDGHHEHSDKINRKMAEFLIAFTHKEFSELARKSKIPRETMTNIKSWMQAKGLDFKDKFIENFGDSKALEKRVKAAISLLESQGYVVTQK